MSNEWKEKEDSTDKVLSPQWICMTCKTVVGPVVDDDEHRCKCKDDYLIELWLVAPVGGGQTQRELDDANVERHGQTSSDDRIYSDNATGATLHRR